MAHVLSERSLRFLAGSDVYLRRYVRRMYARWRRAQREARPWVDLGGEG